jgi:hypothetical protein
MPAMLPRCSAPVRKPLTRRQTRSCTIELADAYRATIGSEIVALRRQKAALERRGDRASIQTYQFVDLRC